MRDRHLRRADLETAGKAAQIPPNPQLLAGGGRLHQADTLADLAHVAGLSPAGLAETVAGYNDAVRGGNLAALFPARSTRSGQPHAIETPPFFAIPICAGITNTMDGIAIDGHGRVKQRDGRQSTASTPQVGRLAGSKVVARSAMSAG